MDRDLRSRFESVVERLRSMENPTNVEGMARFGISSHNTLGISVTTLRAMARSIPKDHDLAIALWKSGIHEARILASMIDEPSMVTREQTISWTSDLDSWDICDQVCSNLFDKTPFAYEIAMEFTSSGREFVKRAGFVIMAALSVHDKNAPDESFMMFLPVILRESRDDRNFVKKAVNWALRQIGKRNLRLNELAIEIAEEMSESDSRPAKWIASDALRELRSEAVLRRLSIREPARRPARRPSS